MLSGSFSDFITFYAVCLKLNPVRTLLYGFFLCNTICYILSISYYAVNHFIIEWKTKMWEHATDHQVIEEIKYVIRKHNDCADLDTIESTIRESIELTKYSESYRIECYRQGLKHRVKCLENV
jgi:hypothetical protein